MPEEVKMAMNAMAAKQKWQLTNDPTFTMGNRG